MSVPEGRGDLVETDRESESADENGGDEDGIPLEDGVVYDLQ